MIKIYPRAKNNQTYWQQSNEAFSQGHPYITIGGQEIHCDWIDAGDIDLEEFGTSIVKLLGRRYYRLTGSELFVSISNKKERDSIAKQIAEIAEQAVNKRDEDIRNGIVIKRKPMEPARRTGPGPFKVDRYYDEMYEIKNKTTGGFVICYAAGDVVVSNARDFELKYNTADEVVLYGRKRNHITVNNKDEIVIVNPKTQTRITLNSDGEIIKRELLESLKEYDGVWAG